MTTGLNNFSSSPHETGDGSGYMSRDSEEDGPPPFTTQDEGEDDRVDGGPPT